MRVRAIIRAALVSLALVALPGACKQDANDVCQIDDDCEPPLQCNAGTMRCQRAGSDNDADAAPPADAAIAPDAAPPDAAPPEDAEPAAAP
jgi:hypothetical protein